MRIKVLRVLIIISFVFIIAGLFYHQVLKGRYFFNLSKNNRIRVVPFEGWRGRIKDRNGKMLADNRISYNVMIVPQELTDSEKVFSLLSDILGAKKEDLKSTYEHRKNTPFAPVIIAEDISRDNAIVLEENKFKMPGVLVDKNFKRFYPLKENSSHILGYVGKIGRAKMEKFKEYGYSTQSLVGYSGVEEYYDSYLQGNKGGVQIEINSRGKQVRLLSLKEPTKGQDIALTIDSGLQDYLDEIMEGNKGSIVVMDVANGEILGMVSSPNFDPNIFMEKKYQARISSVLSNSSSPLLNRAIKGTFPPGSVFKVPVAIAALDTKKASINTTYHCNGFLELGGRRFGCTHVHGDQNMIEAIAHSCNVYFFELSLKLGADTIHRYAKSLGLGELTHIDLPYEEKGFIPSKRKGSPFGKKRWYTGDTLNFAIGQGNVLVTPLQITKMMATVATDGVEVQPHLIKSIGGMAFGPNFIKRQSNIHKDIFENIKKGLRAAVIDYAGTANLLNIDGLFVAGKTGTAQTTKGKEHHAWFAGYVKGSKKTYAFCVFLEHGGSSQNANVVARQMLLYMQKEQII